MEPDDFMDESEPLDDAAEWETNQVAADLAAEFDEDMADTSITNVTDD